MVHAGQQEERSDPQAEPTLSAVSSLISFTCMRLKQTRTHTSKNVEIHTWNDFPRGRERSQKVGPSFTFTLPLMALHRKTDKTPYQSRRVCNNVISKTVLFQPLWELDRPEKCGLAV